MSYSVFYSDPDITTRVGFGKVADIPCIFDSRPGYHREASRYLIDRGLGIWSPGAKWSAPRRPRPTRQTMRNYAHWLANFLEWTETRGVDPRTCDYIDDIHGRYQVEMRTGLWSRDGVGLGSSTINSRVDQACDYLTWMAEKGYRTSFEIAQKLTRLRTGSARSAIGHRPAQIQARLGKVRQNKRYLRMPSDAEVHTWLTKVYETFGTARGLMCEVVLLSAMRREEVASFRVTSLPEDKSQWHINSEDAPRRDQRVRISLEIGTKGGDEGYDHGDKVGPRREIWIPLGLAERLHEYRTKLRNAALKRWVKAAGTLNEQKHRIQNTVHLFLDEKTGKRINAKGLYNAWTGVALPFAGWSPHLGRDWWSCKVLLLDLAKKGYLRDGGAPPPTAAIEAEAMSTIRLIIQPQLGHASEEMAMVYVRWVVDMLAVNISIDYTAELDNVVEMGDCLTEEK